MAGIQIIGAIGIRVKPDLTGFKQDLEAKLRSINTEATVGLKIDTGSATADLKAWQARQEANQIHKKIDVDRSALDRVTSSLQSFGANALSGLSKAALGVTGLMTAFSTLSSVGPLLVGLVGLVGLLPGALAGAGLGFAAIKLGMDGITKAFSSAKPALDKLKAAISDTFRKELVPAVNAAKQILPQLIPGFKTIASSLSGIATDVLTAFKTQGISTFNSVAKSTAQVFGNLGKALGPLLIAFLQIADIGAQMFIPITSGAGGAAQKFLDFTKSAEGIQKIKGWIQGGIDAFKALFSIIKLVVDIVKQVFAAFTDVGTGVGDALIGPLRTLDNYLKSSGGKAALGSLAEAFKTIAGVVNGVFKTAIEFIGPAVAPALNIFKQLVVQIGSFLTPVLKALGPIVQAVFGFISSNIGWIGPLALGITAAVTAFNLFKTAIDNVKLGFQVLKVVMMENPFLLIIAAVIAVAAIIIQNWDAIKNFLIGVWNGIKEVASTVWNGISDFFTGIVQGIVSFFTGAWNGLMDFLSGVWNWISSTATSIWNGISDFFTGIVRGIVSFFTGAWNGLMDFLGGIWRSIKETVVTAWNDVLDFFGGIPGKILSALGDLGQLLIKAGKAILQGLLDGAKAIWHDVQDFFSGIGNWIKDHKGPISYDKRLLIPHGKAIMTGFNKGLIGGWSDVQSTVSSIGGQVEQQMSGLTSGSRFSSSISGAVSQQASVTLQAGNSLEEKISAALSGWELGLDARGVAFLAQKGASLNAIR